jgi:hypothetical protein
MVWSHIEIPCLLGSALIPAFSPRQQPPLPAHVIRHNVKKDAIYLTDLPIRAIPNPIPVVRQFQTFETPIGR